MRQQAAFSGQAATAALSFSPTFVSGCLFGKMSSSSREGCRCGRADCGLLISCELSAGSRIVLTKRLLRACGNLCLRDLFDKIVGVSQVEGSVWGVEDVSLTLKLESDHLSDARKTLSARVCGGPRPNTEQVCPLDTTLSEIDAFLGRPISVSFSFSDPSSQAAAQKPARNAFELLARGGQEAYQRCHWPGPFNRTLNSRERLKDDIVGFLKDEGVGWSEEAAQSHGLPFIHQLSTALWTLDGHHDSLEDRSCAIPSVFKKFNGYQNPEKHKHVRPMLSAVQLHNTGKQLMQIAQQLWMQRMKPAVTRLRNDVGTLGRSMEKYANYLDEKCAAVSANHARTLPVRSPACDHERLELLNAVQFVEPSSQAKYSSLVSALRCADEFSPVFVNDYEPDDASSRRTYRSKLRCSLPFPVVLFTYSHGNNLGDYLYAWTVPTDVPDAELMLRNHAVMKDIESSLPTYHTFVFLCVLPCMLVPHPSY